MQDCGSCGPEWKILSVKQASGSNYAVQFDALRVTSFTWSVVKDCQTFKAGTVSPTSSEVILNFSGINTDGVYWLKAETTACRGFCFPFEFRITHNGGVIEEPLSTPELSVTGVDSDTIRLDWTHGGGSDDFTVQSSTDGETWTDYATYSGTLRTADTSPWTPDTLYWFRIRARKGSSYSDWSNEASNDISVNVSVLDYSISNLNEITFSLDGGVDGQVTIIQLNQGGTVVGSIATAYASTTTVTTSKFGYCDVYINGIDCGAIYVPYQITGSFTVEKAKAVNDSIMSLEINKVSNDFILTDTANNSGWANVEYWHNSTLLGASIPYNYKIEPNVIHQITKKLWQGGGNWISYEGDPNPKQKRQQTIKIVPA